MAKRTFPEGFREKAIDYPKTHPEKSMKRCAADLGIGYSTLRRWINEAEEAEAAQSLAEETVKKEVSAPAIAEKVTEAAVENNAQTSEAAIASDETPSVQKTPTVEDTTVGDEAVEKETSVTEEPVKKTASDKEAPEPAQEEQAVEASVRDNWEDDIAFASVGAYAKQDNAVDDDFTFRCKADTSSYKDIQHMAGDMVVAVTAQIGNAVEEVTKNLGAVAERLSLYKKRHDLQKERKIIKKEKEKRQKH